MAKSPPITALIQLLRPRQWVKNLAIFAPLFFSGHLFDLRAFESVISAFVAYCFLASSSYIVNDLIDLPRDRVHPYKKRRPLPRMAISPIQAGLIAAGLAVAGLAVSFSVGMLFFVMAMLFLVLHYANSVILRKVMLIDIMSIATGYFMRVYSGSIAAGYSISIWLSLAVFSLSLLIAIGKRRAELTLFGENKPTGSATALLSGRYTENMVNAYTAMFATAAFLTYSYFTFLAASGAQGFFFPSDVVVDPVFIGRKWMMITIPIVMYGIMRYLQLIFGEQRGTLEEVLFRDKSLVSTAVIWVLVSFVVVYGIGG